MFRLNDAVRRYQAQHPSQPESRRVAASVATVATPPLELTNLALLIKQLREEGALLLHHEVSSSNWEPQ